MNHLAALIEDKATKSVDRQRLKGFLLKWREGKILLASALYVNILQPASCLSLTLQCDNMDVVMGIKHILKSSRSLNKLQSQDPLEWPTAKLICSKIKEEDDTQTYQGAVLHNFNDATKFFCKRLDDDDLKRLDDCMRDRLEWSDVELLRSILVVLDTQSWYLREESKKGSEIDVEDDGDNLMEIKVAFDRITTFFRAPLELSQRSRSLFSTR